MQVGVWHAFPLPFDWQEIIGPSAVFKQLADADSAGNCFYRPIPIICIPGFHNSSYKQRGDSRLSNDISDFHEHVFYLVCGRVCCPRSQSWTSLSVYVVYPEEYRSRNHTTAYCKQTDRKVHGIKESKWDGLTQILKSFNSNQFMHLMSHFVIFCKSFNQCLHNSKCILYFCSRYLSIILNKYKIAEINSSINAEAAVGSESDLCFIDRVWTLPGSVRNYCIISTLSEPQQSSVFCVQWWIRRHLKLNKHTSPALTR